MNTNLEVANEELRKEVKLFSVNGLPRPIVLSDYVLKNFTDQQEDFFNKLGSLADREKLATSKKNENQVLEARKEIRQVLQNAIVSANMIEFGIIQRQAIAYGAIPDPDEAWKYYRLIEIRGFGCWNCGTQIISKKIIHSVHYAEFSGPVGGGEVRVERVPYCPECDAEPIGGLIRETVSQSLGHEM